MDETERPSARRARVALVAAATEIVLADGVEALTVREAAQRAGYSVASLYNHIEGIPGLLAGVRHGIEAALVATLAPSEDSPPRTHEAIVKVFVDYAWYFCERPHAFDLLFGSSVAARAAGTDTEVADHEASLRELWGPTFAGLVAAGELAPDRVERTAMHLIFLVHGALLIAFSSTQIRPHEVCEQVREAVTWVLAAESTSMRSIVQ
jgi:AcrR family transcriptional regulator